MYVHPKVLYALVIKKREVEIITRKPVVATEKELKENNRAHSAKLRVAEKYRGII